MDSAAKTAYQRAVKEILKKVFGFDHLRAGQSEVIETLMAGRSALAIFPTGGGKSLCYQLPAIVLEGTALIISPLLALMKDQVDGLVAKGVAAARLDSTLSAEEYIETVSKLKRGDLKLLYVSPEKLGNTEFQKQLKGIKISLIAVDEAHCISEWGHSFRPDYLKLAAICRKLRVPRILALTATATLKVEADIRRQFRIAKNDVVKLSFHRNNLDLRISPCSADQRKSLLLEKLAACDRPAIIYVTRQETAEEVATFLAKNNHHARAYHAGLRSELRREIQESFMAGEIEIVVATIAFGMGVDKSDIRAVFHYNLPKSLEGYTQEIGRAGRDGKPAICDLLACAEDQTVLENFIFSDIPSERAVRNLLERVLRLGEAFDVSIYELATTCDIRQTVIETLFTYLEMDGVLEVGGKSFDTYRLKLLRPLKTVLAGRKPKERKYLEQIFAPLDAEWKWLSVKIPDVAPELGISSDKLRELISELETGGDIALKKSGWRQAYRLKKTDADPKSISAEMAVKLQERETRELSRLDQVLALAQGKRCLTQALLTHFGEKMEEPCGHCDRCRGISPVKLKRPKPRKISPAEHMQIQALLDEKHAALGTPRQLARFLCGMSSPASMRARLYRNDTYGLLSGLPFTEVEVFAESLF
jgi:ATP-dependent DNA helicase RecQ